jgi:hypothetical protein
VDTGSREENASKQESRASVLIQSEPKKLWSMIPKSMPSGCGRQVYSGFPSADKRGTRLREGHAPSKTWSVIPLQPMLVVLSAVHRLYSLLNKIPHVTALHRRPTRGASDRSHVMASNAFVALFSLQLTARYRAIA